jgi:hypothetical protein
MRSSTIFYHRGCILFRVDDEDYVRVWQAGEGKLVDQRASSKAVLSFYGAIRHRNTGFVEKYCHLTGWLPEKQVKCAHLVPKSLESDELAYIFGVRETVLSEPRDGMFISF